MNLPVSDVLLREVQWRGARVVRRVRLRAVVEQNLAS